MENAPAEEQKARKQAERYAISSADKCSGTDTDYPLLAG